MAVVGTTVRRNIQIYIDLCCYRNKIFLFYKFYFGNGEIADLPVRFSFLQVDIGNLL